MGFFKNYFKKRENDNQRDAINLQTNSSHPNKLDIAAVASAIADVQGKFQAEATVKEQNAELMSQQKLLEIYAAYFIPNVDFYSQIGSDKYKAYFGAINAATLEMLNNPRLYEEATKRKQSELLGMVNNKVPGLTNSLICALIYCVGDYSVIKSNVLCVDFSESVPHCIALYLLLTAQKLPKENRTQIIDAGDRTNKQPLTNALEALKVCDPDWKYQIY